MPVLNATDASDQGYGSGQLSILDDDMSFTGSTGASGATGVVHHPRPIVDKQGASGPEAYQHFRAP